MNEIRLSKTRVTGIYDWDLRIGKYKAKCAKNYRSNKKITERTRIDDKEIAKEYEDKI